MVVRCDMTRRMTKDASSPPTAKPAKSQRDVREARRKEALKANMGRRKAQARARSETSDEAEGTDKSADPEGE